MKSTQPFFSVIITTYNRKNYLLRAINSVLQQNFSSYEIIVIDDHSIDNIEELIKLFKNINYIKLDKKYGVAKARNIGMQNSNGKYIAFLDDDDEYLPYFLNKTYRTIIEKKVGFTWCGARYIKYAKNKSLYKEKTWNLDTVEDFFSQPGMYGLVVSREVIKKIGGFDEKMTVSEDIEFIIRLIRSKIPFYPVNDVLINIHYHADTRLSSDTDLRIKLDCQIYLFEKHESFICSHQNIYVQHKNSLAAHYYRLENYILKRKICIMAIEKFLRFEFFNKIKKLINPIIKLIIFLIISLVIYGLLIFFQYQEKIIALKESPPSSTSFMQYRQYNQSLQYWESNIDSNQIGIQALILAEDPNFFQHAGFDYKSIKNALIENLKKSKIIKGGSTITQQLARNLFLTPEKTFQRKFKEAMITIGLEMYLDKEKILEIYLNVIEFGHHVFGIEHASQYYFSKSFKKLEAYEFISLISIIPKPAYEKPIYSQWSFERSISIIENLKKHKILTGEEYNQAIFSISFLKHGD